MIARFGLPSRVAIDCASTGLSLRSFSIALRVDVLVVEARFVETIGSRDSLRSAQQLAAITPALVLCYHLPNRRSAAQTRDAQGLAERRRYR
eukprot:2320094-Pleurochrysis_carterae.AAC.1